MRTVKLEQLHLLTRAAARERFNRIMQEASGMVAAADEDARRIEMLIRHALGAPGDAKLVGGELQWDELNEAPAGPAEAGPSEPPEANTAISPPTSAV